MEKDDKKGIGHLQAECPWMMMMMMTATTTTTTKMYFDHL